MYSIGEVSDLFISHVPKISLVYHVDCKSLMHIIPFCRILNPEISFVVDIMINFLFFISHTFYGI